MTRSALAAAVLASMLVPPADAAPDPAPARQEAGLPFLRTWSPREYRAQAQNWAVAQDARGMIYVANGGGVLEFDGLRWRLIPTATRTIARSLAVDPSGRIYVGAVGDIGVLAPDAAGRMQYTSLLERVPKAARDFSDVYQTFVTPDGVVFASFERILRLRGDEVDVFTPGKAFHFAFRVHGRLFVREEGRGLLELKGRGLEPVPDGLRFADERIYAMVPWGGDGAILLASRTRGLFVLERGAFRALPTEVDADLVRDLVFSGTRLPDGGVALGTIQGGVYLLDRTGRLSGRLDKARGLPDECAWATFVDREGGLWLGLDRGLARVQVGAPLSRFDERVGLPGMVIAIHRHEGRLFAGTSQGTFRLEPGPEARFLPVPGLQNQTWAFLSRGKTLLVANNDGVFALRDGRVRPVVALDGASALHASRASPGRVFVGFTDGVASIRQDGDRWIDEGLIPGATGDVRRILETADGRVWVGTQAQGVLRLTPATDRRSPHGTGDGLRPAPEPDFRVERFGAEHGLPGAIENSVFEVRGEAVFATHKGIRRFDDARGRFEPDPRFVPLFAEGLRRISSLREDARGRVWVHVQDEAGALNETGAALPQADGTYRWEPRPLRALGEASGIWGTFAEEDGLWLGGDDGLFRLDARDERSWHRRFQALVRQVGRVGGDEIVYGGAGDPPLSQLDDASNALRFEYAAPAFEAPDQTRFQVLLEGNDQDWSPWTAEGFREYTNLGPGEYRFRVRARDLYGTISDEAAFGLRVAPPWYRTGAAWVAWFALALVAGRGGVRWRLRRVEAEKRTLEGMVALRTRELRARNEQLETLNKIVRSINEQVDFDDLLETMLRECRGVIRGVEKAAALVRLPGTRAFTFRAALGYQTQDDARIELDLEEAEARYVVGAEQVSPDIFVVRGAAGRPGEAKLRIQVAPQAMLVVRIRLEDEVEGYLVFVNHQQQAAFDAHDLDLLRALREHFLSAFEKARSLRLLERARRTAEDARGRAEEASLAKSAFLANMSHELRTPLHGVLGFAQLMDRVPERTAVDRAHLATILRSGEHLLGLINDVLSLSRIEAGQLTLVEAPFDLRGLVSGVASLMRVRAEARDLLLATEGGELPPVVIGDEGKLRQVLLNLVGNAVKFTESGGVTLRTSWADDRALFEVVDTGPGIAPDELSGLFTAFAQTERGRRAQEGSGLGLALARQFARLMGGEVSASSEVGRGSTFRVEVRLPRAAEGQSAARGERRRVRALAPGQPAWRVLAVDDVAENRVLLRDLLQSVGFEVREASGGEEAVAVWHEWQPHLVWMDKRMPGLDGLAATRRIREVERATGRQRVPILALSASALEHERSEILAAGCDDFVPKPFREGALFEKIAEHLDVRYVYDDLPAAVPESAPVTAARLAGRPAAWRQALREALVTGDLDAAAALAREVEGDDPALARDLLALLKAFRLEELERALAEPEPAMSGEIFLVDDNPHNLELLAGILRGHGFKVRMVNDGRKALEMIRARLPELVLLDITMPQLDGYEVCRQLKADPLTAALPVLFISALDDPIDKVKAFSVGGVDYVPKPFQAEEVLARVETHLAIGRLQRQLEERGRRLEEALHALEEVSRTDPLTGLRNRRFLLQHVDARVAACLASRATAEPHDLAFLIIDADHFKQVNDQYGHAAGDAVLAQMGARLRDACSADDLLVRWGGEEFLVVARVDTGRGAEQRAERLRAAVAAPPFTLDGGRSLRRTCSVGFACLPLFADHPDAAGWGEVAAVADAALYAAKRAGRDGWVGLSAGENGRPGSLQEVLHSPGAVAAGHLEVTTNLDRAAVIAALSAGG